MPVSPVTQRTSKGSTPRTSATTATSTSSEPCPISVAPQNTVTLAAAVEQQLHAALRHLVPVDRQPGAAEIGAAGDADAAAVGKLLESVFPIRACDDLLDALREADRADLQPVRRERIRLGDDAQTQLGRVHAELLRDLVELHFLAEARLRRAVASVGAARRLVGEDPR